MTADLMCIVLKMALFRWNCPSSVTAHMDILVQKILN